MINTDADSGQRLAQASVASGAAYCLSPRSRIQVGLDNGMYRAK